RVRCKRARETEWSRRAPSDIDGQAGGRVSGSERVKRLTIIAASFVFWAESSRVALQVAQAPRATMFFPPRLRPKNRAEIFGRFHSGPKRRRIARLPAPSN